MAVSSASLDTVEVSVTVEVQCKLCLQQCPLEEMNELEECKCSHCHLCMKQYIEVCVSEGNVLSITCPDAQCEKQGQLQNMEIQKLVDERTYKKFIRLKFDREVDLDPNRTWCPEAGCETICHVSSDATDRSQATLVDCPTCSLVFCSDCKAKWHENHSCDPHDETTPLLNPIIGTRFKRCPSCKVRIELDDGCPQITCSRCHHFFCWHCLSSLKGDVLLLHYEKGPCRNKSGHPRSQLIIYRIVIVLSVFLIFSFIIAALVCLFLFAIV